jgi:hypothetical protein
MDFLALEASGLDLKQLTHAEVLASSSDGTVYRSRIGSDLTFKIEVPIGNIYRLRVKSSRNAKVKWTESERRSLASLKLDRVHPSSIKVVLSPR